MTQRGLVRVAGHGARRAPPATAGRSASTGRPDAAHCSKPPSRWPDDLVVADAQRLAGEHRRGPRRARRRGRSADRGPRPSRARSRTTSSDGIDNEPGMWPATWVAPRAGVDDERAPGDGRLERLGRERGRLGHVRAEQPRAGLVRSGASGRSSAGWPADRPAARARTRRSPSAAGAGCGDARSRSSSAASTRSRSSRASRHHGSGGPPRSPRSGGGRRGASGTSGARTGPRASPEQVGPSDRARPAANRHCSSRHRLVGAGRVGDRVADVLGRVPGRVERAEPQPPDLERRAVGEAAVLVARARRRRR